MAGAPALTASASAFGARLQAGAAAIQSARRPRPAAATRSPRPRGERRSRREEYRPPIDPRSGRDLRRERSEEERRANRLLGSAPRPVFVVDSGPQRASVTGRPARLRRGRAHGIKLATTRPGAAWVVASDSCDGTRRSGIGAHATPLAHARPMRSPVKELALRDRDRRKIPERQAAPSSRRAAPESASEWPVSGRRHAEELAVRDERDRALGPAYQSLGCSASCHRSRSRDPCAPLILSLAGATRISRPPPRRSEAGDPGARRDAPTWPDPPTPRARSRRALPDPRGPAPTRRRSSQDGGDPRGSPSAWIRRSRRARRWGFGLGLQDGSTRARRR
jgi:hypothetical protein